MELFSLLAKLTLDTKEYEKALSQARTGANIELQDPRLGLDTSEFDEGIRDAENTEVDDPADPELGLDKSDFDSTVTTAEGTDVADPTEPELGLDTSEFSSGVSEAEELGAGFGETMKGVFEDIKGALAAAGITTALVGVINFLKQGINLAKDHGDAIDKQSQKLKVSTKTYQELDYALTLSGASITDMTRAMRTFTEISGGKTTDDQVAAFEALGISATDASGKMKSAEQLMEESLYALADYGGADRGILQEALFGRNSAGLNALLNAGSAAIKDMRQEANDLGLVMTDEEVKNAAAYMDATTRLEKSIQGLQENFAGQILPLLTDAANTTAKIVAFFSGRTGENSLSDEFKETDKALSKDLASIEGTSSAAMDLVDKLFAMGDAEKLTAEQQAEWKETADWLIKNIPDLSGVIDADTLSIKGNREEIEKTIKQWEKLAQEKAIANAKEEKYNAMLEKNADAIDKVATARARENDATQKQYERISLANQMLADEKNADLARNFAAAFGTTEITKDAENLTQMLDWLHQVGYEFADTRAFETATDEFNTLNAEAAKAKEDAKNYQTQLDKAQDEYESWLKAINELYGIEEEDAKDATGEAERLKRALDEIPEHKQINISIAQGRPAEFTQAKGNWDVPYDNYPSLLHRGEMVLTASDARRYREGTRDADMTDLEDRIIKAIQAGMENAKVSTYLNGKDITDEVSRELTQQASARRFR